MENFDFGKGLEFGNQYLDLDFEGLKIGNSGHLNFEKSQNFASN